MSIAMGLDKYRAPAVDRGLDILELLATTEDELSQAAIAKSLHRSPNEIYRMLDRLVRRDYVRRTHSNGYELTLKLSELSYATQPVRRLVNQAMPVLHRFARDAEQAVQLVVRDRNILVVVAQVDGPGYWNVSIRVGSRISLVNTGSGHVFLAFASDDERTLILDDHGEDGQEKRPAQLLTRLARVREQGYEAMESQQAAGVTNLSVPILAQPGRVIAALTCPFTYRLDKKEAPDQASTLKLMLVAGREISARSI